MKPASRRRADVLVTGASGYIGSLFLRRLRERRPRWRLAGVDVRSPARSERGVDFRLCDVASPELQRIFSETHPRVVVHLASIVTPPRKSDPEFEYRVDVLGTQNVLEACVTFGTKRLVLTSSGAAYGYHADNPAWLSEEHPLRGNDSFPYSKHKRLVEELLARYRAEHPRLDQVVFRPGTVLGATTRNQITNLFEKRFVPGIAGSQSPFVFIWDEDVVECLILAVTTGRAGIFNLAGDGSLSLREIARILGVPFVGFPAPFLKAAFAVLHPLGLSRYRAADVDFLRYRPVLSNARLKGVFGYTPRKTTREVFAYYLENRRRPHGT